ncbi:LysM peptidoglycan-binding domain-containing protein [Evansella cellulosilytica]|uniref:NLP/P60 protein n=1 Tax=Evansella cellulosilytica (strain ATCC 21833 / DSM 2522 / FERM P-1141 / JCM 9156 / N-4) TaxID=649639 RepID=E6TZL2_EVAC2|nr:C40 family peptidase [Evansella cellulosilytica]ADU31318.1 NLP/P60 protein [Evansella cellulosilytica DSM 2522]
MKKKILSSVLAGSLLFGSAVQASTYSVQSGDSLWRIATNNNITVKQLMDINNLQSTLIRQGQTLKIEEITTIDLNQNNTSKYLVQSGDTLSVIAKKHGLTLRQLLNFNSTISNPNVIRVGQEINVSSSSNTSITQLSNRTSTYTVQAGDFLSGIARNHGLTLNQILSLNPSISNANLIRVGQQINVQGNVDASPSQVSNSNNNFVESLIADAKSHLGTPYLWGGITPSGFDSSGFIVYTFNQNGISLPRTHRDYYPLGSSVVSSDRQRGDVVFFETWRSGASHAGIYLGNGEFIHASSSRGVTITKMDNSYWASRYIGTKRYR